MAIKKKISAASWKTLPKLKKLPDFGGPIVWYFGNHKGGVGKTTLAFNFAHFLNNYSKGKILVVEMDSQRNFESSLMTTEEADLISEDDYLSVESMFYAQSDEDGNVVPYDVVRSTPIYQAANGINIISATKEIEAIERFGSDSLANLAVNIDQLCIDHGFEHVLIDSRPSIGFTNQASMLASDLVIMPIEAHQYSLDGVYSVCDAINRVNIKKANNEWPLLRMAGVVANRVGKGPTAQKDAQAILDALGDVAFKSIVRNLEPIRDSTSIGVPVWEKRVGGSPVSSTEVLEFCIEAVQRGHEALKGEEGPYDEMIYGWGVEHSGEPQDEYWPGPGEALGVVQ